MRGQTRRLVSGKAKQIKKQTADLHRQEKVVWWSETEGDKEGTSSCVRAALGLRSTKNKQTEKPTKETRSPVGYRLTEGEVSCRSACLKTMMQETKRRCKENPDPRLFFSVGNSARQGADCVVAAVSLRVESAFAAG